jgi:hypothetical protein
LANTLGFYNPVFYAQESLIQLEKALGMANRCHRGFESERSTFNKGDTINIKRPSNFTVQNAPSTAQDVLTDSVQINLDQWKEVKFKLSDKELAYTSEQIITEHIRPAAVALADYIDLQMCGLYTDCPWFFDVPGTTDVTAMTGPYNVMFDNKVPLWDQENMHMMIDGALQADLTGLNAFATQQGAGGAGIETQMRGTLGHRYGMEVFANQNVQSHTKGTLNDTGPLTNGTAVIGATTIVLDAGTLTGTMVKGDVFSLAGNTQKYAVTALATAAGNAITVNFTPGLAVAVGDGVLATVVQDNHVANLAFHKNFAALGMAKLPETGARLGAQMASIMDPITGLAIRSRLYYVGNDSEVHVALDVLFGFKTLDPNLACRVRG